MDAKDLGAWMCQELARLIAACGTSNFLENRVLTPNETDFPGRWTPDPEGVRTLLLRLMHCAGLEQYDAVVRVADLGAETPLSSPALTNGLQSRSPQAAAMFHGLDQEAAYYSLHLAHLSDPTTMVGALSHEVAHAFRAHHGVTSPEKDHEEQATDLTAIFLGFGVLLANSADRFSKMSQTSGIQTRTTTVHSRLGYLPVRQMCRALALQSQLRDEDPRIIRRSLDSYQRDLFDEAMQSPLEIPEDLDGVLASAPTRPTHCAPREHTRSQPLSQAQKFILHLANELDGRRVPGTGLLDRAEPLPFHPRITRSRVMLEWDVLEPFRAERRRLSRLEVPTLAYHLIVLTVLTPRAPLHHVVALIPDAAVGPGAPRDRFLKELFRENGVPCARLLTAVPTRVSPQLEDREQHSAVKQLFRRALDSLPEDLLASRVEQMAASTVPASSLLAQPLRRIWPLPPDHSLFARWWNCASAIAQRGASEDLWRLACRTDAPARSQELPASLTALPPQSASGSFPPVPIPTVIP